MIAVIAHSFYALTKAILTSILADVSSWNNLLFMPEALAVVNTCYMSKVTVHNGQCGYPHVLRRNNADNLCRSGQNCKLQKRFFMTSFSANTIVYTAFTLTQFGSVISSGTVTKCSVSEAEPCRTDPRWDLLTEPGQYGSVRLFGECKHFYNRAKCFQSDKRATSGRAKFAIVRERVIRVSYERFLLQG